MMNAEDWHYAGEGGKHALFAYRPTTRSKSNELQQQQWEGILLRLDKLHLAQSSLHCSKENTSQEESRMMQLREDAKDDNNDDAFLRGIVKPQFEQYLNLPERAHLSWNFVHALKEATWNAQPCPIPESRRKTWITTPITNSKQSQEQPKNKDIVPVIGWLIWDYRTIFRRTKLEEHPGWSLELKPKAGYLTSSSLVHPSHMAKYFESRYVLLQALDRQGNGDKIQRGWKSSDTGVATQTKALDDDKSNVNISSHYDPMDLFSKDANRIRHALESLWACPQNNFKLWFIPPSFELQGNHDSVASTDPTLVVADQSLLLQEQNMHPRKCGTTQQDSSLFSSNVAPTGVNGGEGGSGTQSLPTNLLIRVIGAILESERALLDKLLQWQRLDILDGDGAIHVYHRLIYLCNGSHHEAQQMLDQSMYPTQSAKHESESQDVNLSSVMQWSPYPPPAKSMQCPAFMALCQELDRFASALRKLQESSNTTNKKMNDIKVFLQQEHQASRQFCLQQIVLLQSREACCYLLQNWLLSLVACDVSFFVTLQQETCLDESAASGGGSNDVESVLKGKGAEVAWMDDGSLSDCETRIVRRQTEEEPGIVQVKIHQGSVSFAGAHSDTSYIPQMMSKCISFQYKVKLIDCDKKPAKKLQSRHQKEQVFALLTSHYCCD